MLTKEDMEENCRGRGAEDRFCHLEWSCHRCKRQCRLGKTSQRLYSGPQWLREGKPRQKNPSPPGWGLSSRLTSYSHKTLTLQPNPQCGHCRAKLITHTQDYHQAWDMESYNHVWGWESSPDCKRNEQIQNQSTWYQRNKMDQVWKVSVSIWPNYPLFRTQRQSCEAHTWSIFNTNVKSVLMYWAETWRVTKKISDKIHAFPNCCLHNILGVRLLNTISNKDLLAKPRKRRWRPKSEGRSDIGLATH